MEEKTNHWINNNPSLFSRGITVVVLLFGICLMIGAIKNWDWLYKADGHYQAN